MTRAVYPLNTKVLWFTSWERGRFYKTSELAQQYSGRNNCNSDVIFAMNIIEIQKTYFSQNNH